MTTVALLISSLLGVPADAPVSPDLAEYQAASAAVGRDPDAHVRLALWCEARGLQAERVKHLALAVLADPANATARGLMGLVPYAGRWKRPEAVARQVRDDEALTAKLADYNARRARAAETADAQWDLALWCARNGLEAEARAHFTAVTRLDPARDAAWKRLGCRKVNGRWATEAQLADEKAEAEAQKKADRYWKPLLTRWRGQLGDKLKGEAAEAALAAVSDPRAVPSVWSVFVAGKAARHEAAVPILGRIDSPASSRVLAYLAVFDASAETRRAAAETLRRRDPREFAGVLVALLRDPIKYEVRPVGGPGSPGVLVISGQKANLKRVYSPPPMPNITALPGDFLITDENGLPVLERVRHRARSELLPASAFLSGDPNDPINAAVLSSLAMNPMRPTTRFQLTVDTAPGEVPVGRIAFETQKTAIAAQRQLEADVATIDRYNESLTEPNSRIRTVLTEASGRDLGGKAAAWEGWWVDQTGFRLLPQRASQEKPTVTENVPLDYQLPPIPMTSVTAVGMHRVSCFGPGTPVLTLDGSRAIETLRRGDRVLTQDVKTGALGYQPVTFVHRNPPSPTFHVKVGGDTIVSSPFHRFWVVGKGWKMARDLTGGETLRLLDGPARVESVESGPVQHVYNLDVAGDHDFFAGSAAALVHDNTLPETRLVPFDAPPELAAVK